MNHGPGSVCASGDEFISFAEEELLQRSCSLVYGSFDDLFLVGAGVYAFLAALGSRKLKTL